MASRHDDVEVLARFINDEQYGIALPLDSSNVEVVDAALRGLESDGSLDDLAEQWLEPVFAADPDDIPVIRAR